VMPLSIMGKTIGTRLKLLSGGSLGNCKGNIA
jgi:hypothetical protein